MATGIIFGGYFLNKQEFKIIFQEWLAKHLDEFILELTGPNGLITTNGNLKSNLTKEEIFLRWNTLEDKYFKNPEVTLIAAVKLNGPDSSQYTWTQNVSEKLALRSGSLSLGTESMKKALLDQLDAESALTLNNLMNTHYQHLVNSLNSIPDDGDIAQLSNYYKDKNAKTLQQLASRIGMSDPKKHYGFLRKILTGEEQPSLNPFSNNTLSQILYGQKMVGAEGKIHDAYMNHVGSKHNIILQWFTNISKVDSKTIESEFAKHKGVKIEEGDNFIPLLTGGLNSTSWMAGGDIVVYNSSRKVIHNIQLKTTIYATQSYHIATLKLKNVLKNFLSLKTADNVNLIVDKIFESLKNDAANYEEDFDNRLEESVLNWVREELNLK